MAVGNLKPRNETSLAKKTKSLFAALFGQLVTKEFWRELFSQVVRDLVFSAMASFGDSLFRFAKTKAGANIAVLSQSNGSAPVGTSSPASSAFSRGTTPAPVYEQKAAYSGSPTQYPGFPPR